MFEHHFYPVIQKENSGWLERIQKYGDLGENFPPNSVFFGMRKSNGIELYQPQNATKFSIFFLAGNLALVIDTNGSEIFVRFRKSGEREYQMKWFIQVERVLCGIFACKFRQAIALRLCSLLGTFATALC